MDALRDQPTIQRQVVLGGECTRDIVKVGFASKLRKNDCFAAACGLAVLRVAAFEKRVDESTRKATLKQILDILRCQIVSTADEKLKNAKQKRRGKLIDNTNDLRIVSILRAVRDGIDAIGYVDAESFLYIKKRFRVSTATRSFERNGE